MEFRNRCGGVGWATRPDGLIELHTGGVPTFEPGSVEFRQLEQTHSNWGCLARSKSSSAGIPTSWTLGIMTTETGLWSADPSLQASKVSYAKAVGLMQVMPGTARQYGYTPEQMFDPALNVECGTKILARIAALGHELPAVAAIYNSGFVCKSDCYAGRCCSTPANALGLCGQNDYPLHVLRWNNTAIQYFDLGVLPCILKPLGIGLAVAGLAYAGGIIAGHVPPPRWLR